MEIGDWRVESGDWEFGKREEGKGNGPVPTLPRFVQRSTSSVQRSYLERIRSALCNLHSTVPPASPAPPASAPMPLCEIIHRVRIEIPSNYLSKTLRCY